LSDNDVFSVKVIGDSILVGTANGLNLITHVNDSVGYVRPGQFMNDVIYDLELVDSSLWIAAGTGAYRLKLRSGRLQRYQDPDLLLFGEVYDIERHENDLWFASDEGLVRLNTLTGEAEPFRLTSLKVTPRALAVNDTIAAVASDRGLMLVFHTNEKPFTREFTTDDGLASNYVFSLLLDGDYLWIGTDKGLTRFLWNNPDRVD
jgi:ligand-binding sensor domain-containing protein